MFCYKPVSFRASIRQALSASGRQSRAEAAAHPRAGNDEPVRAVGNGLTCKQLIAAFESSDTEQLLVWDMLTLSGAEVSYESELWSSSDQALLAKTVRSWRSRSKELCPFFKECIQNVAQLQPESFDVSWKATWIPRQLLWLDSLGKAWPGVTIQYYDVLDRYDQKTQFRWKALFKLFATAFRTGMLNIPVSAIESTWTVTVSDDGSRVSLKERTWLIPMFQQLKVKNRRIARDMLQWQEVRQPADMNYTMWDSEVMQSLQVDEVPGMGQFDIDGIDEEDRNSLYGDALAVMSFTFVIILSFGLSYAWVLSRSFPSSYDVDPALQQYLSDM